MPQRCRVLIADDNEQMRATLAETLRADGLELVGEARDGMEALQLSETLRPDVLVLDIVMPGMGGVGVLRRIKSRMHAPRVLVLSAIGAEGAIREAMAAGADYFMIKPFGAQELCQRIREICQERQAWSLEGVRAQVYDGAKAAGLEALILELFLKEGIPSHIKGYTYLLEAAKLSLENPSICDHITRDLYGAIARRHDTTPSRVERAIRNAVQIAWENGATQDGLLGRRDGKKPSNGTFIRRLVKTVEEQVRT